MSKLTEPNEKAAQAVPEIVRFKQPENEREAKALFVVVGRDRAIEWAPGKVKPETVDIQILGSGLPFPPIQTVRAGEVEAVSMEETLARAFSEVLSEWLTPEQRAQVVERNKAQSNPSICHSHDFCDANMAMDQAWKQTQGREVDMQSDEDLALWDAAWEIAKREGFWFKV